MADAQQVHLNNRQAKALVELTEPDGAYAIVREHRAWASESFMEVAIYSGERWTNPEKAFILDREGGYHRLPDRER